jgi:hypothetical protein
VIETQAAPVRGAIFANVFIVPLRVFIRGINRVKSALQKASASKNWKRGLHGRLRSQMTAIVGQTDHGQIGSTPELMKH